MSDRFLRNDRFFFLYTCTNRTVYFYDDQFFPFSQLVITNIGLNRIKPRDIMRQMTT